MFLKYKKYKNVHTGYKQERIYDGMNRKHFTKNLGPKMSTVFLLNIWSKTILYNILQKYVK